MKTAKEAYDGQIYSHLARLLSILRRLELADLSVGYLAEQYACTIRTIQRDLNILVLAGHPIMPTGKKGFYRLEK